MEENMVVSNEEDAADSDDNEDVLSDHSYEDLSDHSVRSSRVQQIAVETVDSQSSPEPSAHPEGGDSPTHSTPLRQNANDIQSSAKTRKMEYKPAETSMDEDGQTCTICFEPWTNSSEHRLVSLRCGHLFGRSCITRWLKGQSSRCPQCNARARKSEIRNIYAKSVKVMDSTERDKALEDLQKERELRRKSEMEVARERLKHLMAVQECERLKKELMEANRMLQEFRKGSKYKEKAQASKQNAAVFSFEHIIEIAKGGARIVDICEILGMILVSQPSTNEIFPGHGFRKISTAEMKLNEFVLVHQKPIKDMAFHCHDGLVLTASLDKTTKITNVLTNSVVQTYCVDSDVWSCAWDADDPLYFYAGLKTGSVLLFDIRVTSRSVEELPRFGNNTPVVSLQYLKKMSHSRRSKSGPVVGKLSDCSFYQKISPSGDYKIVPLPCSGPFTSISSEPTSGHFLVSCRPSSKQPRVSHTVCEIISDEVGEDIVCNPVQTILGGSTQLQLTRSKLFPHPDDPSSLLICAGDEDSGGALIWDGSSGNCLDKITTESPVLDLGALKMNQKSHLLALTDKSLRFYRWINS